MKEPSVLPVLSLKGGTGKTTTCISIARALQERGCHVGILDVDIHASALPRALHMEHDPGYEALRGGKLQPIKHAGFEIFSIGLLFKEEEANMWDGEQKKEAVRQIATTAIAWSPALDYIVVDTPPTSGDEVQSLLENTRNIYGAVIVCQPNDLAVLALAKTLDVLTETETPIAGVIANMAGYVCPNCGCTSELFDRSAGDVRDIALKMGVRYLGAIPFASEEKRRAIVGSIVGNIFSQSPVIIKKKKGGITRWLISKILT